VAERFSDEARARLADAGWRVVDVPFGATLADLRAAGAPFKGDKYFRLQAAATEEQSVPCAEAAYRGALIPGSENQTFAAGSQLVSSVAEELPAGCAAVVGPAALYVAILVVHHRANGEWLLAQQYTWAADRSASTHLAVGAFGRERPILVSPIPEGYGRGLGVMPLVVPA
jgi:hypothetical protein